MIWAVLKPLEQCLGWHALKSPEAYARFEAEGADIMDMLQNSTLNWSVVLSLLLTMYVSMAVMHTGSSAYASQVAPPPSGWLSPHMVMDAWC